MDKMTCYDPRIKEFVETDNPALVLGKIMFGGSRSLDTDWDGIRWLADYCDELVDPDAPSPYTYKGFPFVTDGLLVHADDGYEIKTDRKSVDGLVGQASAEAVDPSHVPSSRWMESECPGCDKKHRSPLFLGKVYTVGDIICRITCSCRYIYQVIYNTTLINGQDQDPAGLYKKEQGTLNEPAT